jgi:hypothetical protein
MKMSRKMTVVFHDEELYTSLKVEAARRHIAASEIVAEAISDWLDAQEDEELLPVIEARLDEYKEKGAKPWREVERGWEEAVEKSDKLILQVAKLTESTYRS